MQGDAPNTPYQPTDPGPTPSQVGASATAQATAEYAAKLEKEEADSRDISDPSQSGSAPAPTTSGPGPSRETKSEDFSEDLLRRALDAGIPANEAKEYGSPKLLERAVSHIERSLSQYAPPDPAYYQPPYQHQPQQQPQFQPPQGPPPLDPNEFHPELIKAVSARDAYYQQHIAQQAQQLQQFNQWAQQQQAYQAQQRQAQDTREWAAAVKDHTPEEYRDLIGSSMYDATPTQRQAQREAAELADTMRQRYPQMETKDLYIRALRAVHGDKARQSVEREVADKARDAQGRFIGRTASTNGREMPPGDNKAIATIGRMMRERGMLDN